MHADRTRPDAKPSLLAAEVRSHGPVTCFGQTFASDEERRKHYRRRLAEKLKDPAFRNKPGFPKGTDEAILRMSDPPYYTACPNPFLDEFMEIHGRPYDPEEEYRCEPFAVDVSVGKTDPLYKAHGYHTKVPHLAIVPSILHYTKPGDVVLDGFCGSGMTGVAAQWCGTAPGDYRTKLEAAWRRDQRKPPQWGVRKVILGDLSPAATCIAANYNLSFDVEAFADAAQRILDEVDDELGWMYETLHTDGKTRGRINYTVWSQVFACPECSGEVVFLKEALDKETKRVRDTFPCGGCGALLNKDKLERLFHVFVDPENGMSRRSIKLDPVLVDYSVEQYQYLKRLDGRDHDTLHRVNQMAFPVMVPTDPFPIEEMYHGSRLQPKGFTHVHHLFLPRPLLAMATLWHKAQSMRDTRLRNMLLYFIEQGIWTMSLFNRYRANQGSQSNQVLSGVYYVPSQIAEISPDYRFRRKLQTLLKALNGRRVVSDNVLVSTVDCSSVGSLGDGTIDYIFTDPPFGENIYYADLNFFIETWHGVITNAGR